MTLMCVCCVIEKKEALCVVLKQDDLHKLRDKGCVGITWKNEIVQATQVLILCVKEETNK